MRWRLLSDVPDDDVRMLLSVARRRRLQRGEVVFRRDDPGDSLHLIVSGGFRARPEALAATELPAGSMGSKVRAACSFVEETGGLAGLEFGAAS